MATASRKASVRLVAETEQFRQQMSAAERTVAQAARRIKTDFGASRAAVLSFGAAATAALAALELRSSVDLLDSLAKLSERTGVAVESLSALRYAGELADVSMETLGNGLRQLSIEMARGNKAFDALGVQTRDARGSLRNTDDVLADLADRFAGMADGAEKTSLAAEVLGRRYGPELLTLLNQGSAGLRAQREEAERLGVVYSQEAAAKAAQFNDQLTRLAKLAEAAKVELAAGLLPVLIRTTSELLEGRKAYGNYLDAIVDIGLGVDPFRTTNESLTETVVNLRKLQEQLAQVRAEQQSGTVLSRVLSGANERRVEVLTREIALLEARERYLRSIQRLEGGGRGDIVPPRPGVQPTETEDERRAREAAERAAEQARQRAAKSYDDLIRRISARTLAAEEEIATGQKLTESQQFAIDVMERLADQETRLTDAQKRGVAAALERNRSAEAQAEAQRSLLEARRATQAMEERSLQALDQEADALVRNNQALVEQIEEMGRTAVEVAVLRAERLQHAIAIEREELAVLRSNGASEREVAVRERRIRLLEQELQLRGREIARMKDLADETTSFAEQAAKNIQDALGQGVLDVLDGKFDSIGQKFGQMLKNMAAQAIAADIGRLILGDYGVNGNRRVGGLFGTILASILHGGGVAGKDGGGRMVSPMVFAGARRMHSGGLAGDEVPAILRRGEEVLPATHPRHRSNAGSGLSITINSTVHAGAGTDAATLQRVLDARDQALKSDIADGMRRGRWGAVMA